MSKRRRSEPGNTQSSTSRATKRHAGAPSFGAPTVDDRLGVRLASENSPSSSAFSARTVKSPTPPALSNICIRVFAENALRLFDEENKEASVEWIRNLPDLVLPRLFTALKSTFPRILGHAVVTTYFMRGSSIHLSEELPINKETLGALGRVMGKNLLVLRLRGFSKFPDRSFALMLSRLPSLETLDLSRCSQVGPLTVGEAGKSCPNLRVLNLNFTSTTAASLTSLLISRSSLETLKLAGVENMSDSTVQKVLANVASGEDATGKPPLVGLKSLKLRHNTMTDASIHPILHSCPQLERLDLSFTLLQHLPAEYVVPPLQKLSLTSTFIPSSDLVGLVKRLPTLKVLNIGALGVKPGSTTSIMNSTAMTLTDDALRQLTDALRSCPELESVNLVQNTKLGTTKRQDSALGYFIRNVGKRCKILNLSGLHSLRSDDLAGLLPDTGEDKSRIQTLIINKTGIDDDASTWIASCRDLETLEVAETRISAEGLFPIIDSCQKLIKLNLTGCRSVRVVDRRRFFEVWEEKRRGHK